MKKCVRRQRFDLFSLDGSIYHFITMIVCALLLTWASLLSGVSAFSITPLQAGSITVTNYELRQHKVLQKKIDLSLTPEYYASRKDIGVIAAIASLSMDSNINFHFGYSVVCEQAGCWLNFTLVRYGEVSSPDFDYYLKVDYLVAHGLRVYDLNMTSFQEHIFLENVVSFDEKNNKEDLSATLPFNNEDAWSMLLFPSGWNRLSLTGHVVYNYILDTDMYVVHYMDHSGKHGQHDNMGWPDDENYIRFRAVFLPPEYLSWPQCTPVDQSRLTQHYQHTCPDTPSLWFSAFKGTMQDSFQAELFDLRNGFSYSLANTPSRYGLVGFPFEKAEGFIDQRAHEYKWEVEYMMIGHTAGKILLACAVVGMIFLSCLLLRKYLRRARRMFERVAKEYNSMHEEIRDCVETPTQ